MRKTAAVLIIGLCLALCACAPDDAPRAVGTEDGGGTGYGVTAKSVLKLSDFYGVARSSTRAVNRRSLGSPQTAVGGVDTYTLENGDTVSLEYDEKGILKDTTFTDHAENVSYTLFDKLVLLGVLRQTASDAGKPQGGETPQSGETPQDGQQTAPVPEGVFSDKTYERSQFEQSLSLSLDRATVLATIGRPNAFAGRTYRKDSYIVDCYELADGSTLMLDYGFERDSLRAAALRTTGGTMTTFLGSWTVQSKPADLARPTVSLNQVTSLRLGALPADVYGKIGEPAWFEGSAVSYVDAFMMVDGSVIYLQYDKGHAKLTGAWRVTTDGKQVTVGLR